MYIALLLFLLCVAAALVLFGVYRRSPFRIIVGCFLATGTVVFFWWLGFWGEFLWFEALGYSSRFWKTFLTQGLFACMGAFFGLLSVFLLTAGTQRQDIWSGLGAGLLGALIGGSWGFSHWDTVLKYWNRVSTQIHEPILERDTGFYLFTLPLYDALYAILLGFTLIALGAAVLTYFMQINRGEKEVGSGSLYRCTAALLFVLAWGKHLDRYHLMYSTWGAVTGPGWTEAHISLPAYGLMAILTCGVGLLLAVMPIRRKISGYLFRLHRQPEHVDLINLGIVAILLFATWFLALSIIPGLFQWLRVEPNEITFERAYISNNIEFSRHGFKLDRMEEKEFPVSSTFTREMVRKNESIFANVRLWDWRALDAVYKQFQEIRLYYEFADVDIDRYTIDKQYRQVMVAAREMQPKNLPEESQTFVNRRFKYTHGYGLTLTTVHEFTPEGLPNLLIKDIPPKSTHTSLEVDQPQIYYGELTDSHVVVNSEEKEFDYPRGSENVYIRYPGKGGVPLSSVWRKFLFGWKFDGTRFFFSGYPTADSRIMFHRRIRERVATLAPFLYFDSDPYVVLADGKLYWIIDGYTSSSYYPYSEPFSATERIEFKEGNKTRTLTTRIAPFLDGVNYMRNSVKAVIDAFNGSVDFYVFDEADPIIQVWSRTFPHLFKQRDEMPASLMAHIRYPKDLLLVQGLVYAKYHMTDPTVFYNQEDLWIRATEKYYNAVRPVDPYYIMWELPESDQLEFVLILPFTPKNRQVLIGWIAGMCDPKNYGRFLAYKFPKEKRVLGTQQVETKIDQDRHLSGQLSLWDQRGSNVIRGNVLAIPVENTLIYVEPIYLQAETAAYPELRLVAVMHNDVLSYAETFDKALKGLFEKGAERVGRIERGGVVGLEPLVARANDAFESYLRLLGEKRFDESSKALETLEETLRQLAEQINKGDEQ
jgi:uncharacterized membrane protein (UPF0182 family)